MELKDEAFEYFDKGSNGPMRCDGIDKLGRIQEVLQDGLHKEVEELIETFLLVTQDFGQCGQPRVPHSLKWQRLLGEVDNGATRYGSG